MSNEQPAPSEQTPQANGPPATEANAEIERLRQALERAEEERDACREALRVAQAEREEYRSTLYAWMKDHLARLGTELPVEELIRGMREEDGLPLEAFIDEIEQ